MPTRRIFALLLMLVTVYGGLLRLHALVGRYGVPPQPAWLAAVCHASAVSTWLAPAVYTWPPVAHPYVGGDPYSYLKFAREMRSFYQAHVREPVFLALTRGWLRVTHDHDIAISFASLTGSTAWIAGTGALGAAAVSPPVGLLAALALAVDYDAINWAPDGWRDDTFAAFVVFVAWAIVRMQRQPGIRRAAVAGVLAGFAMLTRITALSFVMPGLIWAVIDGPRAERTKRGRDAVIAAGIALVLVAPYLIACARVYGDPFLAIDIHTKYYRAAEGESYEAPQSALAYVASKLRRRPLYEADTAITGLFVRPITDKWGGFNAWIPGLSRVLLWCSVAGLVLLAGAAVGRLLLVIAVSSLMPYALTWNVGGGGEWRFTMHAYSFLLIAAFVALAVPVRRLLAARGNRQPAREQRRLAVVPIVVLGTAIGLGAVTRYLLPPWIEREALAHGEAAMLAAGPRDTLFFRDAWSGSHEDGNVTVRVSLAPRATVRVPLPAQGRYQLTVRADPVQPNAVRRMTLLLNGILLGSWDLTWDPERVGTYRIDVPAAITHAGMNELAIVADRTVTAGHAGAAYSWLDPALQAGLRVWYVRVLPL